MRKIVFFDFDGVIVDSFNLAYQINKARDSGLTVEEYRDRFNGNIYAHFEPHGQPVKSLKSPGDFFKLFSPGIMSMEYIEGIDTVIRTLAQSYTLIINSSTLAKTIREYLVLHSLDTYFSSVFGPETDFDKGVKFKIALEEEGGVNTRDTIFITDTLGDIREATVLGIQSIGVTWGYHDAERLKKGSPMAIVSHPSEIVPAVEAYFGK